LQKGKPLAIDSKIRNRKLRDEGKGQELRARS
jgi:hypothetical protein